jgi:hypothetical protein
MTWRLKLNKLAAGTGDLTPEEQLVLEAFVRRADPVTGELPPDLALELDMLAAEDAEQKGHRPHGGGRRVRHSQNRRPGGRQ